ncbi:transmembrane channel-like protein 7 [Callorhinchus milii]|uniref:Transmembrane channel-like protein n=1 Tax=Callorhinchus milii TaxID=7868 RepID=A0A4W3JUW1_CALMI|nr:transmembrane channel-like protein 7 [Callorhinchus milii]|eukprot:gi/632943192/ref/XP_007886820.1/ PREDICTED: transmembrane channel-like protein 7 isoform X2 [Callorhinchus milii]
MEQEYTLEVIPDWSSQLDPSQASYSQTSVFRDSVRPSNRSLRRLRSLHSKNGHHPSVESTGGAFLDPELTIEEMQRFRNDKRRLRELPIAMGDKRRLREKWNTVSLSSWETWKLGHSKSLKKFREESSLVISWLNLWKGSLHEIEGRFGTGIQSYFTFLRFLVFLNLTAFLLIGSFVLLPTLYADNMKLKEIEVRNQSYTECTKYQPLPKGLLPIYLYILDLVSGTGFMELSYMFYGYYRFGIIQIYTYNIPLAYLLTMLLYFLLCLLWIVKRAVNGVKQEWMHDKDYHTKLSAKVFAAWDSCIKETEMAKFKQQDISNDLKINLEEEMCRKRKAERTKKEKALLYFVRFNLNVVIMILLTGAFFSIYHAIRISQGKMHDNNKLGFVKEFTIQYLPSIVINFSNLLLPFIFGIITRYEDYPPNTEINLLLMRSVFLRMANLSMLVFSLWQQITCSDDRNKEDCKHCGYNKKYQCWESKIGQEMYKLMLFDFLRIISVTYCIELPRKFITEHISFKLLKNWGRQRFLIPDNVLDIVLGQTVVWIGMFYSPLLPLLNCVKYFIVFYIKKQSLYVYCHPGKRIFRASTSKIFFQLVLLIGLVIACIPVIYNLVMVHPSRACGPFRNYNTAWAIIPEAVTSLPATPRKILNFMLSELFVLLLTTVLCVVLTACVSLVRYNRRTIAQLKQHLILAGRDKRYLVKTLGAQSPASRTGAFQWSTSENDEGDTMLTAELEPMDSGTYTQENN